MHRDIQCLKKVACVSLVLVATLVIGPVPTASGAFPGANGRILFDAYQNNTFHTYTVDPDGTDPLEIAHTTDNAWSPDGLLIAYDGGGGQLKVMRSDGSDQRLVWTVSGVPARITDPSWSPDGNRIAFTQPEIPSFMASVRIDGKGFRRFPIEGLHSGRQPVWAPDGRKVAFIGVTVDPVTLDSDADLYVMNEDGTGRVMLTDQLPSGGIPDDPAWSPDGSKIAFSSINTPAGDVYIIDVATKALSNLTETFDGGAGSAAWSPDGQSIVHVRDTLELTVMDALGGNPIPIASGLGPIRSPDWQAACTIFGTSGADSLTGTPGPDRICAGAGPDQVSGGGGNDIVFGGSGADSINSGGGNDIVNAQGGADLVIGGFGNDLLVSGLGRAEDRLRGGDGADRLDARDGSSGDLVDGGAGSDSCRRDSGDIRRRCP